ncbi:MAG: arginine--tRNA ligase [Eubacteriales bacterium]|nr:arginine--tRNA ligase [Eubacteriales bacterium]
MADFKGDIAALIAEHVEGLSREEIRGMIEIPQNKEMGDYAFPCFRLAKTYRKAPQMIAADIAEAIRGAGMFAKVEQVNAYVNMFMSREQVIRPALEAALDAEHFGFSDEGRGKTIVIDFSSPNIAKPFHIGHIRTTVIGYSIYKIYDSLGYNVVRTNHLGDYGTQFGKMICAYRHWGNDEDVQRDPIRTLLSYYTKFHVEAEKDPELNEEARKTFYDLEHGGEDEIRLWKWFSDLSLREFNRVYDMMGIEFDAYDGESMYSDMMPRHIEDLKQKGLLKESQGAMVVNLDQFDLPPALIQKSDGTSLYCTRDIATAVYRKEHYDFYKNIYVVASQQTLYFRQLFKVLELMGYEWAKDCVHVPFGMVALEEGTLSTRKGRVVFLEDVLNKAVEKTKEIILEKNPDAPKDRIDEVAKEVGIGAVMFNELSNSRIKDYVFKWDQVLNFDGETGPYVQYTHARCCSVLRKAGEETLKAASDPASLDLSYLTSDSAYDLVRLIEAYPAVVKEAAQKYEPSIVTRHIIDVAQAYNKFYHDEHILVDDEAEKNAKVALTLAAKNTLKNGLALLAVKAPERM